MAANGAGGRGDRKAADVAAVAVAMVFPTLAAWFYFVTLRDDPRMPAAYAVAKVVQFAFPAIWVLLLRRCGWPRGILSPRRLGWGLGSGIAIAGLLLLAYVLFLRGGEVAGAAAPRIADRIGSFGVDTAWRFLLLALFLSVLHSFLEEYYWRWYVHGELRRLGAPASTVLSSLAFMSHHVVILYVFLGFGRFWWATVTFSLCVGAAGALWAWLYERGGSLAAPWISHILADLAIMTLGYELAIASA